jgi:3-deoxy-D-manno-octulosonate 8-phosphate phosphatase (KDO 8-P phosphatase)
MQSIIDKAKQVRLLIFDVDGVLTSGILFYGTHGTEFKNFHVHDGLGMKLLQNAGISIAIITSRESEIVTCRMQDLGIEYLYQNQPDKILAYEDVKKKLKLTNQQIAYVGDDLPDLPLLRRAGLAITVPNAPKIMQQYAHWTTTAKGGEGAAREVCDFIIEAQGLYSTMIEPYLR